MGISDRDMRSLVPVRVQGELISASAQVVQCLAIAVLKFGKDKTLEFTQQEAMDLALQAFYGVDISFDFSTNTMRVRVI